LAVSIEALIAMALALGAGGLVKGALGMGLPIVALPILVTFLGVQHSVALLAFPLLTSNLWQAWRFRSDLWQADFLPALLVAGGIGIVIGTILIASLPERSLSLTVAGVVFAYAALRLVKPQFAVSRALGRRLAAPMGFGAGVLQGATGMGGPIGATFVHAMRLNRTAHIAVLSAMFLLFVIVQIPALVFVGLLTWPIALESAVAVLPTLVMVPVGAWLSGRFGQVVFDRLVLALLIIVAVQLLVKNLGA
jgi:uncharacterized membrane protein YfcA